MRHRRRKVTVLEDFVDGGTGTEYIKEKGLLNMCRLLWMINYCNKPGVAWPQNMLVLIVYKITL